MTTWGDTLSGEEFVEPQPRPLRSWKGRVEHAKLLTTVDYDIPIIRAAFGRFLDASTNKLLPAL